MKFDSFFDLFQFTIWLAFYKRKSLKSFFIYLYEDYTIKSIIWLLVKDVILIILFIVIIPLIFALDEKVWKLNGMLILTIFYTFIFYNFRKFKPSTTRAMISMLLFSFVLLYQSYDTKSVWHSALYMDLGSSIVFIALFERLLLRKDMKDEKWKKARKKDFDRIEKLFVRSIDNEKKIDKFYTIIDRLRQNY